MPDSDQEASCQRCQQLDADEEPSVAEHAPGCQYREVERSPAAPAEKWECLRCEQIAAGHEPTVPDHSSRCRYREGGDRDPEQDG